MHTLNTSKLSCAGIGRQYSLENWRELWSGTRLDLVMEEFLRLVFYCELFYPEESVAVSSEET